MKDQLAATLLVMSNVLEALRFIIPLLYQFLRQEMQDSLRMLSLGGRYIRSVVFEEEQENNQDQVLIPDVVFYPNIALDNA